jgi:AraC-like DNA-binding protein
MDTLTEVLHRVRLTGTLLFHYEFGRPFNVELPQFPDAVFHYLRKGSATIELREGPKLRMADGDFVVITDGSPHVVRSGKAKPLLLLDLDRQPAHLGVVRHGGEQGPVSTLICGYFTLTGPARSNFLELLPQVLHFRPDHDWLEMILQRMVTESAIQHPGQCAVLARLTEVLFVEVLRSWTKSLGPGEGGWIGAIADPHIGKALQLIHEQPGRPWTLRELGRSAGLGRSAFAARFKKLVGQSVYRYLVARRMDEAALMLETSNDTIARIASATRPLRHFRRCSINATVSLPAVTEHVTVLLDEEELGRTESEGSQHQVARSYVSRCAVVRYGPIASL